MDDYAVEGDDIKWCFATSVLSVLMIVLAIMLAVEDFHRLAVWVRVASGVGTLALGLLLTWRAWVLGDKWQMDASWGNG